MTVGWVGTAGNRQYLDPLKDVFARLADERVAVLEVVSSDPWERAGGVSALDARRGIVRVRTLRRRHHAAARHAVHAREGGFKLLQSLAAGVGVVASPVGVNRSLVERSGGGLLAETPEEWETCLRSLAADHALRAELGARGRAFAEDMCDLEAHADTLAALLSA